MFDARLKALTIAAASVLLLPRVFAAGPSFRPDARFTGSSLSGWRPLGAAEWRARDGEIIGTPREPSGGFLLLDRQYQDVGLHASFRCSAACDAGVLLRAERTGDGVKGVYVSVAGSSPSAHIVTLDASGRELRREPLRSGGGQIRIAPPADPAAVKPAAAPRPSSPPNAAPPVGLPLDPPDTSLRPGSWNDLEVFADANIVRAFLNDGREAGWAADDDGAGFGSVGFFVGGAGEVRFRDVAYKDLAVKERAAEEVARRFRMQRLSDFYYSWGAAAADFNRDGVADVVAGPHLYFGPAYASRREIYLALTTNPSDGYTEHAWMQYAADFTGDGWPDVINASFTNGPGVWLYENPRGEPRRWTKHHVVPRFSSEVAVLHDLDGDRRPELVYSAEGTVRFARPDPAGPTGPWVVTNVSVRGHATPHGLGVGDINGDGRADIVNPYGWWEQPQPPATAGPWAYHPQSFSRYGRNLHGGSVMAVYDVNGDALNDVVTVLNPHGWGLAWFEQKRTAGGISFVRHMIMDDFGTKNAGGVTFSQPHGTTFGDVDGDRIPDFIVGKRYWAHRDDYLDPDPYGEAVLYWYRTVRNRKAPGGAEFVPELIHNRSGAGSDLLASDLNEDGRLDVVTSTRFGTFIFWGR